MKVFLLIYEPDSESYCVMSAFSTRRKANAARLRFLLSAQCAKGDAYVTSFVVDEP